MYTDIVNKVDMGHCVDVLYLDFSKAFDLVNHDVLVDMLQCLGVSRQVWLWVRDFLSARKMFVSLGGECSGKAAVASGVPQGSVLGPLLFIIYVNAVAEGSFSNWYSFADDFKLYISFPKGKDSSLNRLALQNDLVNLNSIAESWNLKLNPQKCVVIRFGDRHSDVLSRSGYWLGGSELRLVQSHKDLGVTVDCTLKFHGHVDIIVNKANAFANQLLRATVNRSRDFMLTLFVSHIINQKALRLGEKCAPLS